LLLPSNSTSLKVKFDKLVHSEQIASPACGGIAMKAKLSPGGEK